MKYIIGSTVGTDDICFEDGTCQKNVPGSAGVYALSGIKIWDDDVIVVGGIGPQYFERHGAWYDANCLKREGLKVKCPVTPTCNVNYREEDDRSDEPEMGLWQFRKLDPTVEEISAFCDQDTKGIYVFKHLDIEFFEELIDLKKKHNFKILWEISEDAAIPDNLKAIEKLLEYIDIFSINRKEAISLYAESDVNKICNKMVKEYNNTVYFRQGKEGAYVIADHKCYFASSYTEFDFKDPTGGGNSSSAGFLVGICEQDNPLEAGIRGSVTASFILSQIGPPEKMGLSMREEAKARCKKLMISNNKK